MTSSRAEGLVRGNNGNGVEVKSRRRNEEWGEGGGVQTDKGKITQSAAGNARACQSHYVAE
jgi:hypothetical protein